MATNPELYSHCINTFFCENPYNSINATICGSCGAKLLVGDRYRLIELIEKQNAEVRRRVYRAVDTLNNNQELVLKIIDYPDEKLASYLRRECEFLRSVPKPFIQVEPDAYFEWLPDLENDFYTTYVLVLPWIEGQDSLDWIKENGPLSESQCIEWILRIVEYLELMSDMSTMHRDIKPSNVIVTPEKTIELIDFGSVRRIDEDYISILEETAFNADGTPRRGTRLFTFGYSPPEQLIGRAVLQSDFYALGKTAIYWITGRTPADLIEEDIDNWFEGYPTISQSFIRFINWLTSKKAAQRPVNANAIRQYIEDRYPTELEWEKRQNEQLKQSPLKIIGITCFLIIIALLASLGISSFYLSEAKKSISGENYTRALKELDIAGRLNPFSNDVTKQKGYANLWSGNHEEARKLFSSALMNDPEDWGLLYHLGILNEEIDTSVAKEFYRKAIEAEPLTIESELRLARIALESNELDDAEKYLNQVLRKVQKHPEKEVESDQYLINFYLGWLNMKKQKYEEAYMNLEISLLNQPQNSQRFSVTSGDVVCLLAEVNLLRKKKDDKSFWKECFFTRTATSIGTTIRHSRASEFINNSL